MFRHAARAALLLAVAAAVVLPAAGATETYSVDPIHSSVGFKVRHLFSKVPGRFNEFDGTIKVDRENLANSSVNVTINVPSIDTANERRDGHLKSPDFFDAEAHPKMTFVSTKVVPKGKDRAEVHGDLTIRGVSKPVVLDTEILGFGPGMGGYTAGFEATTTINRKDFGITWNRVLDQGGAVLGDDVEINLNIEAKRQEPEQSS